jgi:hypothetical protein
MPRGIRGGVKRLSDNPLRLCLSQRLSQSNVNGGVVKTHLWRASDSLLRLSDQERERAFSRKKGALPVVALLLLAPSKL